MSRPAARLKVVTPALVVAGVSVLVVIVLTGVIFVRPPENDTPILVAAPILFVAMIVSSIVIWVDRRKHTANRTQIDCSLRVMDGTLNGLSPRWRVGVAATDPGVLHFRRFMGGARFFPGPELTIKVASVYSDLSRPATFRMYLFAMAPGSIVTPVVTTDGVRLEMAVPREDSDWVLNRLLQPANHS